MKFTIQKSLGDKVCYCGTEVGIVENVFESKEGNLCYLVFNKGKGTRDQISINDIDVWRQYQLECEEGKMTYG